MEYFCNIFQLGSLDFSMNKTLTKCLFVGTTGPLKTGYATSMINGTIGTTFNDTLQKLGMSWDNDVNSGKMHGLNSPPKTIDIAGKVREDAARAYYWPIANRKNLVLYQNTYANKLLWKSNTSCGDSIASGIEVRLLNGTIATIHARKEVIISAGALRSSLILELSGVGNPDILGQYDIPVVVDLPTVGENLQDQMNNALTFTDNETLSGSDSFIAYPTVSDLFPTNLTLFATSIAKSLDSYAKTVAHASNNVVSASDLLSFFKLQYDLVFNSSTPLLEVFITPTASIFSFEYWILLPFSRGNIHISSSNASAAALINPNYFMLDFDTSVQIAGARFIRNIMATSPLSTYAGAETNPGLNSLPANASNAEFETFVKGGFRSNFHPVGTAAMMPREKGGVVDSRLRVYGTRNVRVVDASVLPFQVCGHLTSTLYAVAERAADLIKEDM
jgi:choline dehydrogenase-like flavoprotein